MSTSFYCQKLIEILVEGTSGRLNNKEMHRIEAYVCKQFFLKGCEGEESEKKHVTWELKLNRDVV